MPGSQPKKASLAIPSRLIASAMALRAAYEAPVNRAGSRLGYMNTRLVESSAMVTVTPPR